MKKNNYIFKINSVLLALLMILTVGNLGCKKLVEVDPPVTSLSSTNVYSTDATAIAAVDALYTTLSAASGPISFQIPGLSGVAGLSADELTLYSGASDQYLQQYYRNNLNSQTQDFWSNIYPLIFQANAAIDGLKNANNLTPSVRQQLTGEAMFCRAFMYFYLVSLYGDVPLILTTDYAVNNLIARTPKDQVWNQIIKDLHDAETALSGDYLDGTLLIITSEKVRPTKWAAEGMLARAYLSTGNWNGADSAASDIIGNTKFKLGDLDNVFVKNSDEAIWQLQPVSVGANTSMGYFFILPPTGPDGNSWSTYLNESLVSAFESGDLRRTHWVDSVSVDNGKYYFPYKYKVNTYDPNTIKTPGDMSEYTMVMRLSEQFLIRAEARAQLNNLTAAKADIDTVRSRAGLAPTVANSAADILSAVLNERRFELFTEWGFRWIDLKRTGTVDAVMEPASAAKGGVWNTNAQLYPLPFKDLKADPNLVQNPGYN